MGIVSHRKKRFRSEPKFWTRAIFLPIKAQWFRDSWTQKLGLTERLLMPSVRSMKPKMMMTGSGNWSTFHHWRFTSVYRWTTLQTQNRFSHCHQTGSVNTRIDDIILTENFLVSYSSQFCVKLDELWDENRGMPILFVWHSYLKDDWRFLICFWLHVQRRI